MKVVKVKQISHTGIPKKPEYNKPKISSSIIESSVQTIKQSFSIDSKGPVPPPRLNNKKSEIGRVQPKFYVFSGFATIDERERMSSFLQNEFMNEMLLNKFNMELDKFQVKDSIAEISKKTAQNKTIRQRFYDFVNKGGLSDSHEFKPEFKQDLTDSSRQQLKVPNLEINRSAVRKVSENLNSDGSLNDLIINVEEEGKEIGVTEESIMKLKEMRKKEKHHTHDPTVVRSMKLDAPERSSRVLNTWEEIDEKQKKELNIIRLIQEKELLNQKFSKSIAAKQKEEVFSLNKINNEKDKSYIFIKAAREGDYDAVKYYLQQKNNFVFDHDLVRLFFLSLILNH